MDLLWEVVHEKKLTVVCVLHQINIAKEYGERIIALKKGEVVMDNHLTKIEEHFLDYLYEQEPNDLQLIAR